MSRNEQWALPPEMRPDPLKLGFDFERALRSMVQLRSEVPEDAYTADSLGTERLGHGVIIDVAGRKVVLTIGYLIAEAGTIWMTTHSGRVLQGHTLAYDYASGFGLVQPLGTLDDPPLERGSAATLAEGDAVTVLAHGGVVHSLAANIVARREFAGYWEYLLDDALYTAPAHPLWGGTALLNAAGKLVGIGSLLVQQDKGEEQHRANLFVPIDVIEPLLTELMLTGQRSTPPRPWLGLYATENETRVTVAGLLKTAPAQKAGLETGDTVLQVGEATVQSLSEFYRALWQQGTAGVTIPLTVQRGRETLTIAVPSARREQFLKTPPRH
jgi:S1-C subfamily serine protease